jgi:hypothetical protein
LWLQQCTELHAGQLQSVTFEQQWLGWILMDTECIFFWSALQPM